jgi:5-methylcytosine-specific restriction endonuclease McrA
MMRNKYCLVLNHAYEPCRIVSWKSAIRTVFSKPNVEIIEEYDEKVHSVSFEMNLPSIIRLPSASGKIHWSKNRHGFSLLKPNKSNVYARDNGCCVYCSKSLEIWEATLDHVIPRSKGGQNSFDNIVLSCQSCNGEKGDKIINKPQRPKITNKQVFFEKKLRHKNHTFPLSWLNFLKF